MGSWPRIDEWAASIWRPQFNVGHDETLAAARRALDEAGLEGVVLGGNYVSGVALGKVVEYSYGEFADRIAQGAASKVAVGAR